MREPKPAPRRYLFGPCQDGQHSQCMVRGGPFECSCDCGHTAQREREIHEDDWRQGVPI